MSRLLIKQKVFSWTDTYEIYDENNNPKYFVKADFFSLGHRIHIYDRRTGQELALIQEKVLRVLKEFEIFIDGYSQGIIKQQFTLLRPRYQIDYRGWRLEGDFWEWNYSVYEGSRQVVQISKKLFQWGDTYVLDIADDQDELAALMVAIAMDAANCDGNGQNSFF
ncbi:MAG: LURP-one-related family protein [Lachnospiraceae bacterium]|nr:LURP-one-related family protein [Lachnospiraceae bacterium]